MIEGPPGSGKSSLALALIDRGAVLVGDDGVALERAGDRILASPAPATAGLLEVRNLGVVTMPTAALVGAEGAGAVPVALVPVALVLVLDRDAPRFIAEAEAATRHGAALPLIRLWPESPVLALRAELALVHYGLPAGPGCS
jgi:serine kinase of HPr protein (carbohydrate metabolism regulator)